MPSYAQYYGNQSSNPASNLAGGGIYANFGGNIQGYRGNTPQPGQPPFPAGVGPFPSQYTYQSQYDQPPNQYGGGGQTYGFPQRPGMRRRPRYPYQGQMPYQHFIQSSGATGPVYQPPDMGMNGYAPPYNQHSYASTY